MQSILLKALGLHSYDNNLDSKPGELEVADNVVIDRPSTIEPRRGFRQYGDSFGVGTDVAKQLMVYKDRLIRHYDSDLQYDDGSGTFTSFSGTFSETQTGLRIKSLETAGNFYFTTSAGVMRISATSASDFSPSAGYIKVSGAAQALDINGVINYDNAGFFETESKVAYRMTWAFKDANGNLHEGVPSSRLVLTNYSDTSTGTVDLTFAIPSDITTADTDYFYRIYRTQTIQLGIGQDFSDIDPGDEMNLIIEDYPSNAELIARTVSLNDVTPEAFRVGGEFLYTNPVSGEGILQSNYAPPIAKDIALYQNSVFYANTQTKQSLNLALLSVSQLTSLTSTLTITQGMTSNTYTFRGRTENTDLTFDTFANTTDGGYFFINAAGDVREYLVYMDKTGTTPAPTGLDTVGKLVLRADLSAAVSANDVANAVALALNSVIDFDATVLGAVVTCITTNNGNTTDASDSGTVPVGGVFSINVTQQGQGEDQSLLYVLLSGSDSPSQAIDETARSLVTIINNNPLETVNAFYLSGSDDVPGLILLQARNLTDAQFSLTANSVATGSQFSPTLPTSGTSVSSENEVEPNAIYFSKFQQAEAVPLVNKFNVGPKDKAILRILPLRTGLMVLKEDGIYRITGQNAQFTLDPFDNSAIILAPDSAAVLNNQIYMLSSQGVVTVTDTGVSVISRPIEDRLDLVTTNNYDYEMNTWGIAYETDRAYLLWTVELPTDTYPSQCFRFNTFTNSWTRWPIGKNCGVINPDEDILYLGPIDVNFLERERKNFNRTDFADREYDLQIPANGVGDHRITLSSLTNVEIGDVLLQEQYLTLYQFNQLLQKLDLDYGVGYNDYYSTLVASNGDNLRTSLDELALKLDTDPGLNETDFFSSMSGGTTFQDLQADFNVLINLLNANPNAVFSNYTLSIATITFEALITAKIKNTSDVEVKFNAPLIEGPVVLSRGVKASVVWSPQTLGDPSIAKQIREGTFLFEDTVFFSASVSYASDLSPNFEEIEFNEAGIGDWGSFIWDKQNWGGTGSQVPMRTYVPRDKQRCRFIQPRFDHTISREKFALFGISLTFRPLTERAYRQ